MCSMMVFNFLFKVAMLSFLMKMVLPFLRRRGLVRSGWLLAIPTLLMTRA